MLFSQIIPPSAFLLCPIVCSLCPHSNIIHNTPKWNRPKCSALTECINKTWYNYTMDYDSAKKNKRRNAGLICAISCMNLENIILIFSGSPVVQALCFHCSKCGFDPWVGNSTCHISWPQTKKQTKNLILIEECRHRKSHRL